jgi:hypothetical protein
MNAAIREAFLCQLSLWDSIRVRNGFAAVKVGQRQLMTSDLAYPAHLRSRSVTIGDFHV